MLYGAKVAICFEINIKHINKLGAECKILECLTCWCITYTVGFKRLMEQSLFIDIYPPSRSSSVYQYDLAEFKDQGTLTAACVLESHSLTCCQGGSCFTKNTYNYASHGTCRVIQRSCLCSI